MISLAPVFVTDFATSPGKGAAEASITGSATLAVSALASTGFWPGIFNLSPGAINALTLRLLNASRRLQSMSCALAIAQTVSPAVTMYSKDFCRVASPTGVAAAIERATATGTPTACKICPGRMIASVPNALSKINRRHEISNRAAMRQALSPATTL